MTYEKNYFKGKADNKPYKDMGAIEKIYFPLVYKDTNLGKNSKILDIGCAFGYFLRCCDKIGCDTYGIDISEYAISQAKRETNAKLFLHDINRDISIFKDDFFDVVTMFDILEHLESPYRTLKEVNRILKPNGKLLITTPNINAIDKLVRGKKWYGFQDRSHIYLFCPGSMEFLLDIVGFNAEKIEAKFHPLPNILQKALNRMNLGGQIWVVANKSGRYV